MENAGIISIYDSISGPTPEWLNSFVTVCKPNGSLRICLDPTDLNKYIVHPVCNSYILDESNENQKELQQFMGSVNYLSKFLAFLSDLRAPLQLLLKKDAEFIWTDTHTVAFNHLKEHVSNDVKLQYLFSSKLMHQREELVLQSNPIVQNTLHVKFQTTFNQFHTLVKLLQRQNQTAQILNVNFLMLCLQEFTSNILHMADLLLLFQITSHLYLCSRNHWPILHPGYQECCCKS